MSKRKTERLHKMLLHQEYITFCLKRELGLTKEDKPVQTVKITCDGCGKDLTEPTNEGSHRIVLQSELIPPGNGPVTEMFLHPLLGEPVHFCSRKCLVQWADNHLRDTEDAWRKDLTLGWCKEADAITTGEYWVRWTSPGGLYFWLHPETNRWIGEPEQISMPTWPTKEVAAEAMRNASKPIGTLP